MLVYHIVVNQTLKEYWIAEPKYANQIQEIIKRFDKRFSMNCYPSTNLEDDIETEELRGNTKTDHYLDWDLK